MNAKNLNELAAKLISLVKEYILLSGVKSAAFKADKDTSYWLHLDEENAQLEIQVFLVKGKVKSLYLRENKLELVLTGKITLAGDLLSTLFSSCTINYINPAPVRELALTQSLTQECAVLREMHVKNIAGACYLFLEGRKVTSYAFDWQMNSQPHSSETGQILIEKNGSLISLTSSISGRKRLVLSAQIEREVSPEQLVTYCLEIVRVVENNFSLHEVDIYGIFQFCKYVQENIKIDDWD